MREAILITLLVTLSVTWFAIQMRRISRDLRDLEMLRLSERKPARRVT